MSGTSVVPYPGKKKVSTLPAIDAINDVEPPIDFSFCRLAKVSDCFDEEPRISAISPRKYKQKATESGKSTSKCIRMNNNSLTDVNSLLDVTKEKFENWKDIAWIDLSFNELTTINPCLTEFDNLQILYLHGNQITDLREVEKLAKLPKLRKLTLHGNPVDAMKGYRQIVLSMLPNLQVLDFSTVTKADKKTAETWNKMNSVGKQQKNVKAEED
ncbi:hypothetical protein CHS0354_014966 [Potamilus streckersoni]|uniref:Leucine-rich repeat-containing protein 51 n=1 Tax=Potamilus streckersoni TaxID=2493646 RepID=A0AAE0RUF9_9BIVA|nr:hypothetical protein CHS0354_014966 [Potamilus streckersoni]